MRAVIICPLGPVQKKINIERIKSLANKAQSNYRFSVSDPINTIGEPDAISELSDGVSTPQYRSDYLASLIRQHRSLGCSPDTIYVGVIDAYLFDELFSSGSSDNTTILISIKGNDLSSILRASTKSLNEYVAVEMAAQILAIEYRQHAGISESSPEDCNPPWHKEMRSCLFDYHGLGPDNPTKLMESRICKQCVGQMRENNVPDAATEGCLSILRKILSPSLLDVAKQTSRRPWFTVPFGLLLGTLVGSLDPKFTVACFGVLVVAGAVNMIFAWRKSRKSLRVDV